MDKENQEPPVHPRDYQPEKPAHPAIKWIVALIIGFLGALTLMGLFVSQLVAEAGEMGTDLMFNNFFIYTGGFILIQNMGNSILMFVLTTVYYFLFFTLTGLLLGWIIEWLTRFVRQ